MMGKTRKEKKYRAHLKAPGPSSEARGKQDRCPRTSPPDQEVVAPLPVEILKSLPFVSVKDHHQQDSGKEKEARRKKDRRKARREQWLQKIELSRVRKEEEKAAQERKKMVIVGDMQPLATSLPMVSIREDNEPPSKEQNHWSPTCPLLGDSTAAISVGSVYVVAFSSSSGDEKAGRSKAKGRNLLSEVSHYQDVLRHPAFKQDPMAAIFEHAQNTIASGII